MIHLNKWDSMDGFSILIYVFISMNLKYTKVNVENIHTLINPTQSEHTNEINQQNSQWIWLPRLCITKWSDKTNISGWYSTSSIYGRSEDELLYLTGINTIKYPAQHGCVLQI
jgi:hypothetical protein